MPSKLFDIDHQASCRISSGLEVNLITFLVGVLRGISRQQNQCCYPYRMRPNYSVVSEHTRAFWQQYSLQDRTFLVFLTQASVPSFVPAISYQINQYLAFELNWSVAFTVSYLAYYFALEPVGAVSAMSFA
jgi:hypothetical protein